VNCFRAQILLLGVTFCAASVFGEPVKAVIPSFPDEQLEIGMTLETARQKIPNLREGSLSLSESTKRPGSDFWFAIEHWSFILRFDNGSLSEIAAACHGVPFDQMTRTATEFRNQLAKGFGNPKSFQSGRIGLSDMQPHEMTVEIFATSLAGIGEAAISATANELTLLLSAKPETYRRYFLPIDEIRRNAVGLTPPVHPSGRPLPKIDYTDIIGLLERGDAPKPEATPSAPSSDSRERRKSKESVERK